MNYIITEMQASDWPQVKTIYEEGLATGTATFETQIPDWDEWDNSHLEDCRLVVKDHDNFLGWASLSPVSDRCVYGGVAEISIYMANHAQGKGIGSKLLNALIEKSEDAGIWTLHAGIFPENEGSKRLLEKCGFRKIGYREKIGKLNGEWKDTLLYERRSPKIW